MIFLLGPAEPFSLLLLPDFDDDPEALDVAVPARPPDRVGGADPSTGFHHTQRFFCAQIFLGPRTALLLRTEMTILRAGKLSPLFHKVAVT